MVTEGREVEGWGKEGMEMKEYAYYDKEKMKKKSI